MAAGMEWKRRIIYQVLTDRFASARKPIKGLSKSGPASAWLQRAGGDLAGLASRIGYLKGLEISALWISPLVENSWLTVDPPKRRFRVDGYHGYWARDFQRLDPALGQLSDLDHLLARCRESDIRAVLDVVLNHSNPVYSFDHGDLFRDGKPFASYRHDHDGAFHHFGTLDPSQPYDAFKWENYNVWGLADLAQENARVDSYLKESAVAWLSRGFAGARLDTARHIPSRWLAGWCEYVKARLPDLFCFGEWWDGGATNEISVADSRRAGIPLTDFQLAAHWRRWLTGRGTAAALADYVEAEQALPDPYLKVNFLDNHDQPRLLNDLITHGFAAQPAGRRALLGLLLLLFWRGIPCVYYGSELLLFTRRRPRGKAWGDDPYNREPMRFLSPRALSVQPGVVLLRLLGRLRRETSLAEEGLKVGRVHRAPTFEELELIRGPFRLKARLGLADRSTLATLSCDGRLLWSL
jgi:glycosidase